MKGLAVSVALLSWLAVAPYAQAKNAPGGEKGEGKAKGGAEARPRPTSASEEEASGGEGASTGETNGEGKAEVKSASARPARPAGPAAARPARPAGAAKVLEKDKEATDDARRVLSKRRGAAYRKLRRRRSRRHRRRGFRRWASRWRFRKKSPFTFKKGPYSLQLKAQIQVQAVTFVGKDALYENGDPASDEGLLIRRARLGVKGKLPWHLRYNFMIEAFGDLQRGSEGEGIAGQSIGAQLLDLSIEWARWKEFQIGVGADKVPGPRGRMVTSRGLQLIERPFSVEELAVDRRAGAWVSGDLEYFNYLVGVYNGDDGLSFGNEGGGYLVGARLELTPLGRMGCSFSDYTHPYGKRYKKARFGAGVSFQYQHGPTMDRMNVSGDVGFKWRGLSVAGEAIYVREEPVEKPTVPSALPEVTESLGVFGQVGYFVIPARLELAARFEYMDLNFDIDDSRDIWAHTEGINYHWSLYLRSQLSYTHKEAVNHA